MKNSISKKLSLAFASAAFGLAVSFSAMAATPAGTLEGADNSSVYGWVWDSDSYGHIIPVEISVYSADSSEVLKTGTVKADHYQEKLQQSIGDGYHGFKYSVDWNQFDRDDFRITAYAVTETERVFLGELTYNKTTDAFVPSSDVSQEAPARSATPKGPGESVVSVEGPGKASASAQVSQNSQPLKKEAVSAAAPTSGSGDTAAKRPASWETGPGVTPKKEAKPEKTSLGMFTTTGYCNCDLCCGGSKLTYSGVEPQPGHTISADINLFPIGTKLMIGDTVYTVEDIGSNVVQNKIDIFYATHEEAAAHGTKTEEVFAVAQ